MLRDVFSGLTLAAVTGALYALGMYFGPVNWTFGDDTWDMLVLIGIMLSVSGFFAEFLGSRLSRRLREASIEIYESSGRFDESSRARALRLNAYARAPLGCTAAANSDMKRMAKVIPFPVRRDHFHPAIAH
jgi:hypothetical protein